ncbi:MAG TPA: sigma-70 family RNA polymerase sigma factor [Pirellulaceae bacterium]
MTVSSDFVEFLGRVRGGDQSAAEELVLRYEPVVRREVRLHMEDSRLGRLFDSIDVSQSVLGSFFVRAMAGQYELEEPGQLSALLVTMARNKIASKARWQFRQKRESNRADNYHQVLGTMPGDEESPSQIASAQELIAQCCAALTDEERQIAELRGQAKSWKEVAEIMGDKPDARRMQLHRAIERVSQIFGLND